MREISEQIKTKLAILPKSPGIYKMLDSDGAIIYIGKSKCLKNRVYSYFVPSPKWEKVKKMTPFIFDIEFEVTDTHLEAMLLECEMIKRIKPYFNVQMKNDSRYAYLKVEEIGSPTLLSIGTKREKNTFGPFRRRSALFEVFDLMKRIYPIEKSGRSYLFEYHIFPVTLKGEVLEENRKILLELCKNPKARKRFLKASEKKMLEAAKNEHYETAATYRNLMDYFGWLSKGLDSYQYWVNKTALLDIKIDIGHKLFLISQGNIIHKGLLTEITPADKEAFLMEGKARGRQYLRLPEEIGAVDYRDIIYSELKDGAAGTVEWIVD